MCERISWTLSYSDKELLPLDTVRTEVYKNTFKHGYIHITFGVVSPWSKFVILCDHISWTLQLTDMELVLWETANIMMCWSIGTSALDLELRAHKINQVWWFDIGNWVRLYLLNPTTVGMELTFIDPANVGILQWQSHHMWSYEPMNVCYISWALVCMSQGGSVPPYSYICCHYIFFRFGIQLMKRTMFVILLYTGNISSELYNLWRSDLYG